MSNERLEELAALHAVGLLDEAGRSELLSAAAVDPEVQKLVRECNETAALLACEPPEVAPPPRLRQDILRRLPARGGKLIYFPQWVPYAVAACLMALAIVQASRVARLKTDLVVMKDSLREVQAQKTEDAERKDLMELCLARLQAKDAAYASASVMVAWNRHLNEGVVEVDNLPAPPPGHDYQLWVLDPRASAPINGGLIQSAGPARHFTVPPVSTSGPGFAVSLEPSGGVNLPTGPILFAVAPEE
jgi:anti-sigma-K factor RskA